MEHTATWGEAEWTVHEVLRGDAEAKASGEVRLGMSLSSRITGALRVKGLLVEKNAEDEETPVMPEGYHAGVVWGIRHPGAGPVGCPYCIETLQVPVPVTVERKAD